MSDYLFGTGRGKLTKATREDFDRIAEESDAWFCGNPNMPGDGHRFWFACRNMGHPFDDATASAVLKALEAAGYREDGEWTDQCFVEDAS
jgi:hypothetical protein